VTPEGIARRFVDRPSRPQLRTRGLDILAHRHLAPPDLPARGRILVAEPVT